MLTRSPGPGANPGLAKGEGQTIANVERVSYNGVLVVVNS